MIFWVSVLVIEVGVHVPNTDLKLRLYKHNNIILSNKQNNWKQD